MDFIFEFSFDDESERTVTIPFLDSFSEDDFNRFMENEWKSFIGPLEEEYGVHDITGNAQRVGFATYEVDKGQVDELIKIWKEKLIAIRAIKKEK